jgi:hypothetical protein
LREIDIVREEWGTECSKEKEQGEEGKRELLPEERVSQ